MQPPFQEDGRTDLRTDGHTYRQVCDRDGDGRTTPSAHADPVSFFSSFSWFSGFHLFSLLLLLFLILWSLQTTSFLQVKKKRSLAASEAAAAAVVRLTLSRMK